MNTIQWRWRPFRRWLLAALLAVALVVASPVVWMAVDMADDRPPPPPEEEEELDPRPTAAVALGDSFASGEAAGGYATLADGTEDPCRRSGSAQIHQADLPGIDRTLNLACSGATTRSIRLDGRGMHGESPQAEQLRPVAEKFNVELVVITVGANDLNWSQLMLDCVLGFVPTNPGCQEIWAPELPERTATVSERIERVVEDVRGVLREAGQSDDDYDVVLQSYASPVPREAVGNVADRVREGCPLPSDAMVWANDELIVALAEMTGAAADATGARFLDLRDAFAGHEVCSGAADQWVAGLVVDLDVLSAQVLENDVDAGTLLREAMHPNAGGHAQLGRCLARFAADGGDTGACTADASGNARLT